MKIRTSFILLAAALVLLLASAGAPVWAADKNLAIKGYDPVAYLTKGKATKGKPDYAYDWDDAVYQFTSAKHRELFKANPEKYAPRYRGFCTIALSRGVRFVADPENWLIHDGRLHIFGKGVNVTHVRKKMAETVKKADANYKRVSKLPFKSSPQRKP